MDIESDRRRTDTKERVRDLLSRGFTPRQIARELDLSSAAVYQFMEQLRTEAEQAS